MHNNLLVRYIDLQSHNLVHERTWTSLTCDGTETQCSAADAWCFCISNCQDCFDCGSYLQCKLCGQRLQTCMNNCGPKPANVTACSNVPWPLP